MTLSGKVVALGSVFCIGAAIVVGSLSDRARVGFSWSQVPCYGDLLDAAKGSGDLVFLGSSRILMGVDAPVVARGIGVSTDRAFNIAHNDRSYLVDRLLLDELTMRRRPKLVVVEAYVPSQRLYELERPIPASPRAIRNSAASSNIDRLAIGFGTIGALPIDGDDRLSRVHDRATIVARKIEQFAAFTLTGRLFAAQLPTWRRFEPDTHVCRPRFNRRGGRDVGIRSLYIKAFRPVTPERWQSWTRDRPELLTDPRVAVAKAQLTDIAALARARSVPLAFLYLPSKFIPPPTEAFVRDFATTIGAPLLVPSPALLERLQRDGYADESHLNARGRALISAWLGRTKTIDAD